MIAAFNDLAEKYEVPDSTLSKRDGGSTVPLADVVEYGIFDRDYYGPGQVGNQTFNVKFDTGSKTFYVPGKTCMWRHYNDSKPAPCPSETLYNEGGIDEHNITTTKFNQGTQYRTGETWLDTVSLAGVTVEKTQVVAMTDRLGSAYDKPNSILGLTFGLLQGYPATFFEAAMAQGKVAVNEFSFFLGRSTSGNGDSSELTIGGRNPAHFTGELSLLPVVNYTHWSVDMDGLVVNGNLVSGTKAVATLDTGTSFIVGPKDQAAAFWAQIPGSKGHVGKHHPFVFYEFPCDSSFTAAFRLGGKDFDISPKDYVIRKLSKKNCLGMIGGGDFPTWIVGDSFLKNWYSIYSYDAADGKPGVYLGQSKA